LRNNFEVFLKYFLPWEKGRTKCIEGINFERVCSCLKRTVKGIVATMACAEA